MPELHDYTQDDEQIGSATGAPKQAALQPHEVQEYTPWSSFVSANQDVSQREANKLSGQVSGDVSRAQGELRSGQDEFNAGINGTNGTLMKPKTGSAPSVENTAANVAAPDENPREKKQSPAPIISAFGGNSGTTKLGGGVPVSSSQADTASPSLPQAQPTGPVQSPQAQPAQPTTSNPWANFLPDAPANISGAPAAPSSPGAAPASVGLGSLPGARNTGAGTASSAAVPAASKDLEAAMGPAAWSSLIGDTRNASGEANALGSETGVQGLLQRNQVGPLPGVDPLHASAFDAALINGQGQSDFGRIARQYGGNQLGKNLVAAKQASQDSWKKLQGDRDDFAHRQRGPMLQDAAPTVPGDSTPAKDGQPAADPNWSIADDALLQGNMAVGAQQAQGNAGRVQVAQGDSDTGVGGDGWTLTGGPNGGPGEMQHINVKHSLKTKEPDYADWWGGASKLPVGDNSIDAATWYALANMSPAQRAKWWTHTHPKGS